MEEIPGVRGRILLTDTLRSNSMQYGRLACEFDEFSADNSRNRLMVLAMNVLINRGHTRQEYRRQLRQLLGYFPHVTCPGVQEARRYTFAGERMTLVERSTVMLCQFIVHELLPNDDSGTGELAVALGKRRLSQLFEAFVRGYFLVHHPHLAHSRGNKQIGWSPGALEPMEDQHRALPRMETDVFLRPKTHAKALIIDTKFYTWPRASQREGKPRFRSTHLYQIQSYVQHSQATTTDEVMGMLLYAHSTTDRLPASEFHLLDHRFFIREVNLGQHFEEIFRELDEIARLLDEPASTPDYYMSGRHRG